MYYRCSTTGGVLEYGDILYDSCTTESSGQLGDVRLEEAHIVTGDNLLTLHYTKNLAGFSRLNDLNYNKLLKLYSMHNQLSPTYTFRKYFNHTRGNIPTKQKGCKIPIFLNTHF